MTMQEKLPDHACFHLLRRRVSIRQGNQGLRAGIDAVLLGAFPKAEKTVLELGCGVGQALLCYATRNPQSRSLVGIEILPDQAILARANVADNGLKDRMHIVQGDFCNKHDMSMQGVCSGSFDLVLCNPPFFVSEKYTAPKHSARQASHIEVTPLDDWVSHALRYCSQFGWIAMIHRPERLLDILRSFGGRAGNIHLLPVHSRDHEVAKRIVVLAQKSRRGELKMLPPLVMHEGDDYSSAAKRILEDAEALAISLG